MSNKSLAYTYYPGCSLEGLAKEYDISLRAVAGELGLELDELDDWNCCGASTLVSVNHLFSLLAPARSLAIASEKGRDVVVACNSCYLVLRKTLEKYRADETLKEKVDSGLELIGRKLDPDIRVRHLLDVVVEDLGLETIEQVVSKPLKGMRIAPYYGCQIARPYGPTTPTNLNKLLDTLGAEVTRWESKTRCCGSSLLASLKMEGLELACEILADAEARDVDAIAVMCPLCQINLDAYQSQVNAKFGTSFHIPVLYFTQLLGLAMGMNRSRLAFDRLITSPNKLLNDWKSGREVAV